jgi:hypothetical protein
MVTCRHDSDNDGVCDENEVEGCTDVAACNFDPAATESDGSCQLPMQHRNCQETCFHDVDGDDVCDEDEVIGCTRTDACNYDERDGATDLRMADCEFPETDYDCLGNCLEDSDGDGFCDGREIYGCTDLTACNTDAAATELDMTACVFPETYLNCLGNCLRDEDGDGVCDEFEVLGCTDTDACNPDDEATENDGSCSYAELHRDCLQACLRDDDGDSVCDEFEVVGCQEPEACNYNSLRRTPGPANTHARPTWTAWAIATVT